MYVGYSGYMNFGIMIMIVGFLIFAGAIGIFIMILMNMAKKGGENKHIKNKFFDVKVEYIKADEMNKNQQPQQEEKKQWTCEYCGSINEEKDQFCKGCGSKKIN